MKVESVTESIHANVEWDGANVACIETAEGLVLVDTPMLPKDIAQWQEFVLGLDPKGVKYIVITHAHFDHIIGCRQLGGTVIMHEKARARLFEENATLRESMAGLAPERTEEEVKFILSEPLIPSEITMGETLTLNLGETTLALHHVGGHSDDSIVVHAVEDRVLLTGDNITSARHPYKGHACFSEWIEALEFMDTLDVDTIVPGHGEICGPDEIGRFVDYMRALESLTSASIQEGMACDAVVELVSDRMFDYFETEPERLEAARMMFDFGTRRLYQEIQERGRG
jgi:glyoxylase-like metal-dependent hydrolase (beta-lactamase superfamily II)